MRFILLEEVQENLVESKKGKFLCTVMRLWIGVGGRASSFIPGMSYTFWETSGGAVHSSSRRKRDGTIRTNSRECSSQKAPSRLYSMGHSIRGCQSCLTFAISVGNTWSDLKNKNTFDKIEASFGFIWPFSNIFEPGTPPLFGNIH